MAQIKVSPCEAEDSDCADKTESQLRLPEDIIYQIHALMPMQDAAQAACVSRDFLRSWRSYPKLILSIDSLGIKEDRTRKDQTQRDFINRVEHVLQNHSGTGVKKFSLQTYPCSSLHPSYIDHWLKIAAIPGIEELELLMFEDGDITKKLDLCSVHITGEELYGFLSNSCALEQFYLSQCNDVVCLKIPHLLQQLNFLDVFGCENLEMINSNAPNLSTFSYIGHPINISLGGASEVRKVIYSHDYSPDALYYASTKIPVITPYLQTLVLATWHETINTPALIGKFLHLKYLEISALTPNKSVEYDFSSVVSFVDASPALETFVFHIGLATIRMDSIVDYLDGDSWHPRCISEHCHDNLKNVMITGFCSAESMIAFTIHIIEKSKSLECLTMDTTRGHDRRIVKAGKCLHLDKDALIEAEKALLAIRRYIKGRVPEFFFII